MKKRFIAVLDSGIGGLSVFSELYRRLPNECYLYFGDTKNVPYGSKSEDELASITEKNLEFIFDSGMRSGGEIKAVVVGCNTLSVGILGEVAPKFDVPMFGVYPDAKGSVGNTIIFCTPLTAKKLLKTHGYPRTVRVVPLKDLAADIEKNKFDLSRADIKKHFYGNNELDAALDAFRGEVDTVILGCTHYVFVKRVFVDHFKPQAVTSGNHATANRVHYCLKKNGLCENDKEFTIDFIGDAAEENLKFYKKVVKPRLNFKEKN